MDPIEPRITGLEHKAEEIREAVERMASQRQTVSQGGVQVTFHGLGSMAALLALGLSIGVALGAAIACAAWVAFTMSNVQEAIRNNEAFIQATYQQAPEIRARFDQIKAEQAKEELAP
jgi:hypothetical protein